MGAGEVADEEWIYRCNQRNLASIRIICDILLFLKGCRVEWLSVNHRYLNDPILILIIVDR